MLSWLRVHGYYNYFNIFSAGIDFGHVRCQILMCKVDSRAVTVNPLSPRDALKHHFTTLKTDLIFLQQSVLK